MLDGLDIQDKPGEASKTAGRAADTIKSWDGCVTGADKLVAAVVRACSKEAAAARLSTLTNYVARLTVALLNLRATNAVDTSAVVVTWVACSSGYVIGAHLSHVLTVATVSKLAINSMTPALWASAMHCRC